MYRHSYIIIVLVCLYLATTVVLPHVALFCNVVMINDVIDYKLSVKETLAHWLV